MNDPGRDHVRVRAMLDQLCHELAHARSHTVNGRGNPLDNVVMETESFERAVQAIVRRVADIRAAM